MSTWNASEFYRRTRRLGRRAVVRLGGWGRELPRPVRRSARRALEKLPQLPGVDAVRRTLLTTAGDTSARMSPGIHQRTAQRLVPWSAAGSTYSQVEISTFLQMESAVLRAQLAELTAAMPASTPITVESLRSALNEPHREPCEDDPAARELADQYAQDHVHRKSETAGARLRHLVIVGAYPRTGAEYANGFVHRRIQYYLRAGTEVHVAVLGPAVEPEIYEYDGVRVLAGPGPELRRLLRTTAYRSVSVHALSPYMWDHIKDDLGGHRLFCFLHGFEARRWIRTLHNFRDAAAVQDAVLDTLQRQRLWRRVLDHPVGAQGFIFVSRWWRRAAQEDMELVFPGARSTVVHNLVEPSLFRYVPKDAEDRFKILWVRSANNLNYGSDLAVRILQELQKTPYWDRVTVRIIGDGRHFGAFAEAFDDEPNVRIERRYASQAEIAQLHREHGIFLVPSRQDSQGVSRDEAMSSGLVPVTNRVGAVPEFVDDTCAVLAAAEDVWAMVDGIVDLFEHPEKFLAMSAAASQRAQRQCGPEATVQREMRMLGLTTERNAIQESSEADT